MRRPSPFVVLLFCSSLALIAAGAPPSPRPSPAVSTTPVTPPTPSFSSQAASVLIYPFDVQTGVNPKIGIAIAQILAQEMVAAGGLTVLAVPQNVKRSNFLQYAHEQHADFYISGYVTPVGDSARVVEQLVTVDSGIILFSQTAQVSSVADVASQSLLARSQILAFVGRGTQNIQAQTANTPAPTATNGAQVQLRGINGIVDSVFHHRGGAAPTPTPVTKPSRGVIVVPVTAGGFANPADLSNATNELYFAMGRRYVAKITSATTSVDKSADSICGTNRNNTIASGSLTEVFPHRGRVQITFNLAVYACFGAVLARQTATATTVKGAVDAAVAAYVAAHPENS